MRGKLRGVPAFKATLSGDSTSSCTSILSGDIYSTVPIRSEARYSMGVVDINACYLGYELVLVVEVGVSEIGESARTVVVALSMLGAAPIRCCSSSAILIVALSMADFGR